MRIRAKNTSMDLPGENQTKIKPKVDRTLHQKSRYYLCYRADISMKKATSTLKTIKVEVVLVTCSLSGVDLRHARLDFEFCPYNFRKSRTISFIFYKNKQRSDTIVLAMLILMLQAWKRLKVKTPTVAFTKYAHNEIEFAKS
jgi:hypothetical protein